MEKNLAKKGSNDLTLLLEENTFRDQVRKALPKHLSADRFLRIARTTLTKTPKLANCTPASFMNALLTLSQLGIEPDGRRAHLIPFGTEVQLIIDYKGLAELAFNTDKVSNIHADIICENDNFESNKGEIIRHDINYKKPRGDMYAAYAIVRFKDGTEKCEVMTKDEINKIRTRSKAANAGPWKTDYNEMAKKTVFRRLTKWIPLSPEQRDAIEVVDKEYDIDITPDPLKTDTVKPAGSEQAIIMATPDQLKAIHTICTKKKLDKTKRMEFINAVLVDKASVLESTKDLTKDQASIVIDALMIHENKKAKPAADTSGLYDAEKCGKCANLNINNKPCARLPHPEQIEKCKGVMVEE